MQRDPDTGTYFGTNQTAFRWKRNGIVLTNATAPSLVITNVDVFDAATYIMGSGFTNWAGWIDVPARSLTVRFDPQILSMVRTPPSSAELLARGATGSTITLLISSNLTDWTPLESLECTAGTVHFVDHSIPPDGQRFYQVASE